MYDAKTIANYFIKIGINKERRLTNMQVQKLVYFAHGWHLALTGKPLIFDDVKAWTFGPVLPEVYENLRQYKASPVGLPIQPDSSNKLEDTVTGRFLDRIFQKYGHLDGIKMSYLTHKPETPWQKTWDEDPFGVIPNDLIESHFKQLEERQKQ